MSRKLIAFAAAAAAAAGIALAAPAAHADPALQLCGNIDINGQGTGGEQCIVLPPEGDTPSLPGLPSDPGLPALPGLG